MQEPTCYKNPDNLSCIDLFLINRPTIFNVAPPYKQAFPISTNWCGTVLKTCYKKQRLYSSFITGIMKVLRTTSFAQNYWSLILQILHHKNLIRLCYLFLTSTLQKNEVYAFKQLQFYDKSTDKSNYEQIKPTKKSS